MSRLPRGHPEPDVQPNAALRPDRHPADSFGERVGAVLDRIAAPFRWVDENQDKIVQFLSDSQRHSREGAWAWLIQQLPVTVSLPLTMMLELGARADRSLDDANVSDGFARLLTNGLTEPGMLEEIELAVDKAPVSPAKKRQLITGLRYVATADPELAVPLLINPLEGAFWATAERRGLIEKNKKGKWIATALSEKPGKKMGGVDAVLKLPALPVDPAFQQFLIGLAYGGGGNSYRHGTADDGWNLRALCLVVSVVGWLELEGLVDAQTVIRGGFRRARSVDEPVDSTADGQRADG